MLDALPYRGDGRVRPAGLALPPGPMPRRMGRRPLKRWRYVGAYGPELMVCAGTVRVAGLPRPSGRSGTARASASGTAPSCAAAGSPCPTAPFASSIARSSVDLVLEPAGEAVEVVSRHGASYIWTRKSPIRATGLVTLEGRTLAVDARGLMDETAGYHARHTAWEWSAGAGIAEGGEEVVWNLVAGVHDAPRRSERTVWIDGEPREVGPVAFSEGLDAVGDLRFTPEAERVRRDDLLLIASDYRQPFGTFAGALPDGTALASGHGVMERHRARW